MQALLGAPHRRIREAAGLMAPRSNGVDADDEQLVRRMYGLGRLPDALELLPRTGETAGREKGDVVVSGHSKNGCAEAAKEGGSTIVLLGPSAVSDVASGHDQRGHGLLDEGPDRLLDVETFVCSDVEVGEVNQAGRHGRGRLYTDFVADEPTELFDDLYLGLRAGGAMRKQRRGEPLTMEEEAALNRWQRLSSWRKAVAVGAFALGTFGLGFTLGGLVFGRGRKAKA
jgi:hypothetical protein